MPPTLLWNEGRDAVGVTAKVLGESVWCLSLPSELRIVRNPFSAQAGRSLSTIRAGSPFEGIRQPRTADITLNLVQIGIDAARIVVKF